MTVQRTQMLFDSIKDELKYQNTREKESELCLGPMIYNSDPQFAATMGGNFPEKKMKRHLHQSAK